MKYDATEILNRNLSYASSERMQSYEKTAAHLYEKMRMISGSNEKFSPLLPGAFTDILKRREGESPSPETSQLVLPFGERTAAEEMLMASRILHSMYGAEHISAYIEPCSEDGRTVSYFRNILSDEAYTAFSSTCKNLSRTASANFSASCEEVYCGKSSYCILPIETLNDGRLVGMYSLVDRYELHAVSSVTVRTSDNGSMRFLLLGKKNEVIECPKTFRSLEIKLKRSGSQFVDVMRAASYFSLELINVESITEEDQSSYYVSLSGEDYAISELLYFLFLTEADYTLFGICNHI